MLKYNEFLQENFKKPWISNLPIGTSADRLYSYVNFIANQLGEEIIGQTNLGSGSYGTAFNLKSGKVLKLTSDKHEAKIAEWLRRKNTKYLINCYNIHEITPSDPTLYVLIMDKLVPISDDNHMRIVWEHILSSINNNPGIILDNTKEELITNIDVDYDMIKSYEWIKDYIETNWNSIYGITKEIISLGITLPDIHVGNLGYNDNGDIVHFDIRDNSRDISKIKVKKLDTSKFFEDQKELLTH